MRIAAMLTVALALSCTEVPRLVASSPTSDVAVAQCAIAHGLAATNHVYRDAVGSQFQECRDPRPAYANVEGFISITVVAARGPTSDEASGTDAADRILAPCPAAIALYTFASQGAQSHRPPIRLTSDTIVTVDGRPWDGDARDLPFYRERGEMVVLHNLKNVIDSVRCAD